MAPEGFTRPLTAQEAVLVQIRQKILSSWPPGSPIRQDAVAEEFGVSRVPVREALKILEGEGLLDYVPHKGFIVRPLDPVELKEVYLLREILETEAIRQSVPALRDEHFALMRTAMDELEALSPDKLDAITTANRDFHSAIFFAAPMPRLQHFVRVLRDAADIYRVVLYSDSATLKRTCAEHRAIYAACEARDVDRVIELHDIHRSETVNQLLPLIEQRAAKVAAQAI
jgi:DNA-binding GntR family transcriptional regulator